jgi:hypothetical protein
VGAFEILFEHRDFGQTFFHDLRQARPFVQEPGANESPNNRTFPHTNVVVSGLAESLQTKLRNYMTSAEHDGRLPQSGDLNSQSFFTVILIQPYLPTANRRGDAHESSRDHDQRS